MKCSAVRLKPTLQQNKPGKNSFDGLAQMDSWLVLNLYVVYVSEELVETAHCLSKVRVLLGGFGILK